MASANNVSNWRYTLFPFLRWFKLLDSQTVKIDIIAGITAGVLILPQAIALATVAGVPPQYGLYTSIFPVIIASLWGSSYHALSGPNTALAVLTAMTIAPFANIGTPEYVQYAITLTFMVGVFSLALGLLRLGVVFNYFSHTVMVALVTGVGVIIVIQQIGNFLGVQMNNGEDLVEVMQQVVIALERSNIYAVIVGVTTVASGILIKRLRPKWPHYILAVIIGMLVTLLIGKLVGQGNTGIYFLGYMSFDAIPFSAPDFSPENFSEFASFAYPSAVSMAVLGLMQSAVIARNMAAKSGQKGLDINQEVIGQGMSNIVGSFLSCFTSCGSFNRSAANLESGARTPLVGIVSAIALAVLVFTAAPLIAYLPVPVMAGVLFLVGSALVKVKDIRKLLSIPGEGRIVFVLVLLVTLFSGVDDGVYLGVFLSIVLYLRERSRPEVDLMFEDEVSPYLLPGMTAEDTVVVRVGGSLFFGSVPYMEKVFSQAGERANKHCNLVVIGERVIDIDEAAAEMLKQEGQRRASEGKRLALVWVRESAMTSNVRTILKDVLTQGERRRRQSDRQQ